MFAKLKTLTSMFGPGWLVSRLGYELSKRLGLLRWRMPGYDWEDRSLTKWLLPGIPVADVEYSQWQTTNSPPFLFNRLPAIPSIADWDSQGVVSEAETILQGSLRYFSNQLSEVGFPPDWSTDISTGARVSLDSHWSQISDEAGYDIKYIWEPARFNWAYTLARAYAVNHDERFAEGFWIGLDDWMERNQPNHGPGWMDGQECALRLAAASFAHAVFRGSAASTPSRNARFTLFVAALAERIHSNIHFAVSTRSNHTISEAFGLWLAGTLFPELNKAISYRHLGKRMLVEEANRQLYSDGGYAMYSLNYQRFVLHLYCLALRLGENCQDPFPRDVYDRVGAAADFLFQLVSPESGEMPEFGSNDGALVLPLNTCHFNDFRPLLQLCYYTAYRKRLFPPGPWDEDLFWLYGPNALDLQTNPLPAQETHAFFDSGVYTLRSEHATAILRCVDFRARPSHADQLHMDLWVGGENIAVDAGTFSYNAPSPWRNGLSGAPFHNTVVVDNNDPMTRLSRFTWGDWSKGRVIKHEPGLWIGEQDGYLRMPDPVSQRRCVQLLPGGRWLVLDILRGIHPHIYRLHWLLADLPFTLLEEVHGLILDARSGPLMVRLGALEGLSTFSLVRGDPDTARGWRSRTYGHRSPALSLALEVSAPAVCFWTLFGQSGDKVEISGSLLTVLTRTGLIPVELAALMGGHPQD